MDQNSEKLKAIVESNQDLKERMVNENWTVFYNKEADMILMGTNFPKGSFYFPIENSGGLLLRVDQKNKVYGFSIENTKTFIEKNPEMSIFVSFIVHPYRTRYITLPVTQLISSTVKGIDHMKSMFSISDYIAGKATYC